MKKGKTCKVLPVAMFVFANNQMFFVNLMIEMTMGSRLLQIGHNLREDPFNKMPPLFGHCPFGGGGGRTPCPDGLGHIFREDFSIFCFGQMPGGQMTEPYFVLDKCQEDKCLN